MSTPSPKIFISYSHDSEQHREVVLGLANRLRQDGLDCTIDQYVNGFPPEGWQRWMETHIEQADFVLVVCTRLYLKRYRGLDKDSGRGVTFEGVVISQTLYDAYYRNTKFVPVLTDDGEIDHVPLPLKGFGSFHIEAGYEGLYRYLTGQAAVVAPDVGEPVVLGQSQPGPDTNNFDVLLSTKVHRNPVFSKQSKKPMSDTMKAAWIGGVFVLLGAIIAGLFALWATPSNTTYGDSSPVITGNNNQVTTNKQPESEKTK